MKAKHQPHYREQSSVMLDRGRLRLHRPTGAQRFSRSLGVSSAALTTDSTDPAQQRHHGYADRHVLRAR